LDSDAAADVAHDAEGLVMSFKIVAADEKLPGTPMRAAPKKCLPSPTADTPTRPGDQMKRTLLRMLRAANGTGEPAFGAAATPSAL